MKIKMFLVGFISGIAVMLISVSIMLIIFNKKELSYKEVSISGYEDVLNNYIPDKAVESANSAKMIGTAYINDIYGKSILAWSAVDYDKVNGYWIISRQGFFYSLKKVVIDEKTGEIVSAIGYKN
jgi:hypothetical protein